MRPQTSLRKRKLVMKRDMGLCRCCGFKASQVHHIKLLTQGGKDRLSNMVAICEMDHSAAPNNKEDFIEYMNHGGIKIPLLIGRAIQENKNKHLNSCLSVAQGIIRILQKCEYEWSLEKYNLKDSLKIKDIKL